MIQLTESNANYNDEDYQLLLQAYQQLLNRNDLGFHQLPYREEEWQTAQEHSKKLSKKYSRFIVLGMGGSSLGGKALCHAINPDNDIVEFWDSIDPTFLSKRFNKLKNFEIIHWIAISKSGETLETLSMINYVNSELKKININFFENLTIITEKKDSPLYNLAISKKTELLLHPLDVGGRFSALSVVGLLPAALVGGNLNKMQAIAKHTLEMKHIIAELGATIIASWARGEWITVFWPYEYSLKSYVRWFQQLWAESLAKLEDNSGNPAPRTSTPIYCLGSREQHSVLQQFAEGYRDKFIIFFTLNQPQKLPPISNLFPNCNYLTNKNLNEINQAEAYSCITSLTKKNVNNIEIMLTNSEEENITILILLSELLIGVLGEFLNINSYDQPGVEHGKAIARKYLLS